jgi:hypothetical protein
MTKWWSRASLGQNSGDDVSVLDLCHRGRSAFEGGAPIQGDHEAHLSAR